jgi:hypothetical protein
MPIFQVGTSSPLTRKGHHVKRFRALAIITATAAIVAIPGAATAGGQNNCVAETVQMFKTTFAHSSPGGVADLIAVARSNPGAYPWCG